MSIQSSRKELAGGFFTDETGDLITLDKDGNDRVVVEEAFVKAEAMSHLEGSTDWSVHYKHKDFDGKTHKTTHSVADLHTSPKQVLRAFLALGLRLVPGMGKLFMAFLLSYMPSTRVLRVLRCGWLEGSWVYVRPNWVAGETGETVHLQLERNCPTINSMKSAGTLKEWKKHVAAPLKGNILAMFCILFAFLGPLLKLLGIEGGGINLVGPSSVGKTTGLQCAGSVHGRGSSPAADSGSSYIMQWNQTSNAFEGTAAACTDALTALDEAGLYAGNDMGNDLYLLAGGRGKSAMDSHRRLKDVRSWRGNILSTSEVPMLEIIERKGGRAKAGMLVRLIDIFVINMFPHPPWGMTSSEFSNHMKKMCSTYYGIACEAFVEFLVFQLEGDPESVIADLRALLDKFTREMTPADVSPLQERAIRRFAAIRVAGHVAVEAEILPYSIEEVDECVAEVLDAWLKYRPSVTDVQRALVSPLSLWHYV